MKIDVKPGVRVGKLEVISQAEPTKRGFPCWNCRCDCGRELVLEERVLGNHKVGSCGCENTYTDLVGQKYGMLTVESKAEFYYNGHLQWNCRCDCGNTVKVQWNTLLNKRVTYPYPNCGCTTRGSLNRVTEIKPGVVVGKLTVLEEGGAGWKGSKKWLCRCACGNELLANESALLGYRIQNCGCADQAEDLTGRKYGRLTVLHRDVNYPTGQAQWFCQCDCGNTKVVTQHWLTHAKVPSCGCYKSEKSHETFFKHGMKNHPLYEVWSSMKKRCYNPNEPGYKNYGGRGIYVCDRWKDDFQAFYEDMHEGYKPGLQLDRIDNDGPYSPENCHWVTPKENARNKRTNRFITTALGTKTVAEQAELTGVNYGTIKDRLNAGMPEELSIIPNPHKKRLDIKAINQYLNGEEALDDSKKKMVEDIIKVAEIQAKTIDEWGFGPCEVILADNGPGEGEE